MLIKEGKSDAEIMAGSGYVRRYPQYGSQGLHKCLYKILVHVTAPPRLSRHARR